MTTLTNKRNSYGIKDSADRYREGGKFMQWSFWYIKDGKNLDIQKHQVKEALAYWKGEDSSREYKAVKDGDFYEIFATNPK